MRRPSCRQFRNPQLHLGALAGRRVDAHGAAEVGDPPADRLRDAEPALVAPPRRAARARIPAPSSRTVTVTAPASSSTSTHARAAGPACRATLSSAAPTAAATSRAAVAGSVHGRRRRGHRHLLAGVRPRRARAGRPAPRRRGVSSTARDATSARSAASCSPASRASSPASPSRSAPRRRTIASTWSTESWMSRASRSRSRVAASSSHRPLQPLLGDRGQPGDVPDADGGQQHQDRAGQRRLVEAAAASPMSATPRSSAAITPRRRPPATAQASTGAGQPGDGERRRAVVELRPARPPTRRTSRTASVTARSVISSGQRAQPRLGVQVRSRRPSIRSGRSRPGSRRTAGRSTARCRRSARARTPARRSGTRRPPATAAPGDRPDPVVATVMAARSASTQVSSPGLAGWRRASSASTGSCAGAGERAQQRAEPVARRSAAALDQPVGVEQHRVAAARASTVAVS